MTHIEKVDFRLVSGESGEVIDDELYSRLAWLTSRHAANSCPGAELLERPMAELDAFQMMDQFGMVAGYLIVDIDLLVDADRENVKRIVGERLVSGVNVDELAFEIVWGHSRTIMIYVEGKTAG